MSRPSICSHHLNRPQCNGTITRAIKKLTVKDPNEWDTHLHAVLYAYRTKCHEALNISPYQFLYSQEPRSVENDILQQLGINLGFERYGKLIDQNSINELLETSSQEQVTDLTDSKNGNRFKPGDTVVRYRYKAKNKLDTTYVPETLKVFAVYKNNTYKLCDNQGKSLKRHINHNALRKFNEKDQRVIDSANAFRMASGG